MCACAAAQRQVRSRSPLKRIARARNGCAPPWLGRAEKPVSNFAQLVTQTMHELAKVNPQNHVHAVELYSAMNLILRCPPAPLFALLASRPQFQHVGHLHFRVVEQVAES